MNATIIVKLDDKPNKLGRVRLLVPGRKLPVIVMPHSIALNHHDGRYYEFFVGEPRERTVRQIRMGTMGKGGVNPKPGLVTTYGEKYRPIYMVGVPLPITASQRVAMQAAA